MVICLFVKKTSLYLIFAQRVKQVKADWNNNHSTLLICLIDTFFIPSLKLFALVEKISYLEHSGQQMQGK